jgi:RHS repeat-associated protein
MTSAHNTQDGTYITYNYDYQGRMVQKVVNNETNHFVWNGNHIIAEMTESSTNCYTWFGGETLTASLDGETVFYAHDANKNVTDLVDDSGDLVAHYEYSPFGVITTDPTGSLSADNPFRFSNEYFDETTGQVEFWRRKYFPQLGKFLSRDPIGAQGGLNETAICGNDLINHWDELGLWKKIQRKGKYRAQTCAEPGDTIDGLASLLSLDTDDAFGENGWLRTVDGYSVSVVKPGTSYTIPNSVYVDLGVNPILGYSYLLGIFQASLRQVAKEYESKGFKVIMTKNVTARQMRKNMRQDGIYAYFYGGHGLKGAPGTLAPEGRDYVEGGVMAGRYTPYKIRNMVLYACSSLAEGVLPRKTYLSDPTKSFWNLNVSSSGWVTGFLVDVNMVNIWNNPPVTIQGSTVTKGSGFDYRTEE